MAKHIACSDVVAGCQFAAQAGTEEELLEAVKAQAVKDHGVKEVTPELATKVKALSGSGAERPCTRRVPAWPSWFPVSGGT